jgi:hypothetical protein
MEVKICLYDNRELAVSNQVFPKLVQPVTNGTGLKNLDNRFQLLLNKNIRIFNDGERFTVYLPLINGQNEDTDS